MDWIRQLDLNSYTLKWDGVPMFERKLPDFITYGGSGSGACLHCNEAISSDARSWNHVFTSDCMMKWAQGILFAHDYTRTRFDSVLEQAGLKAVVANTGEKKQSAPSGGKNYSVFFIRARQNWFPAPFTMLAKLVISSEKPEETRGEDGTSLKITFKHWPSTAVLAAYTDLFRLIVQDEGLSAELSVLYQMKRKEPHVLVQWFYDWMRRSFEDPGCYWHSAIRTVGEYNHGKPPGDAASGDLAFLFSGAGGHFNVDGLRIVDDPCGFDPHWWRR